MFKEMKRKKKIKRAKGIAESALIGGVTGGVITAATVALITSKSGKKLRGEIKDSVVKCTDKVKEKALETKEKADKIKAELKEKKDKVKKKTDEGLKDAVEHIKDTVEDTEREDYV